MVDDPSVGRRASNDELGPEELRCGFQHIVVNQARFLQKPQQQRCNQ
jgi:hypothetical protein